MDKHSIRKSLTLSCSLLALALSGTALADNSGKDQGHDDISRASLVTFFNADGTPADGRWVGHARLKRSEYGIDLEIKARDLEPGHAYTVWWIIFNKPHHCKTNPCTGGDLEPFGGDPRVEGSAMNATGRVANPWGHTVFEAFLPSGYMWTNPSSGAVRQAFGPGLANTQGAEIHVIVRSHGPALPVGAPGSVEQISTLFGSCLAGGHDGGCFDFAAAVFPRPWNSWRHQSWMGD